MADNSTDPTAQAGQEYIDETSPDSLMRDFRGRGIVAIILFTVVVHAAILVGSSVPYLKDELFGEDTTKMSKEKRLEIAVREATSALREIADKHDLTPQELSDAFSNDKPPVAKPAAVSDNGKELNSEPNVPAPDGPTDPEQPKSPIEKNLDKTEVGPDQPEFPEEDLF